MSIAKAKVSSLAELNANPFKNKKNYPQLQYLDTGSVTKGSFDEFQVLDTQKDKIPSRAQRAVKKGTIVISTVRPAQEHYGYFENPADNIIVSSGFVTVDADETKVDSRYLYYILTQPSTVAYLSSIASTSVSSYPSYNPDDLGNYEVEYETDLNKQKQIASVLYNINHKIELNNSICTDLEAMSKQIYDYWFVQFDFPDENGKPYKSSGGKMVWNEAINLQIPEKWDVKTISAECDVLLGGTPDTERAEYWNGNIPWLNSGEVANSPVICSEKTITKLGMNNSSTSFAKAGAAVMSITRYIRPAILGIDACFNQSVVAVIPTEQIHTAFIYPLLKSNVNKYLVLRTGAQQPHINKDIVEQTLFVRPNDKVLKEYYQRVEPLYKQQLNTAKETQTLINLRDFLLPMLLNGQIKIGE